MLMEGYRGHIMSIVVVVIKLRVCVVISRVVHVRVMVSGHSVMKWHPVLRLARLV